MRRGGSRLNPSRDAANRHVASEPANGGAEAEVQQPLAAMLACAAEGHPIAGGFGPLIGAEHQRAIGTKPAKVGPVIGVAAARRDGIGGHGGTVAQCAARWRNARPGAGTVAPAARYLLPVKPAQGARDTTKYLI